MVNTAKNVLIILNNPLEMHLKLSQNRQLKGQQRKLVTQLVTKSLIQLQKTQTIYKLLQMSTIKKYLKKDIYLQKKDRKLLMI